MRRGRREGRECEWKLDAVDRSCRQTPVQAPDIPAGTPACTNSQRRTTSSDHFQLPCCLVRSIKLPVTPPDRLDLCLARRNPATLLSPAPPPAPVTPHRRAPLKHLSVIVPRRGRPAVIVRAASPVAAR